jgi:hypothetical protein
MPIVPAVIKQGNESSRPAILSQPTAPDRLSSWGAAAGALHAAAVAAQVVTTNEVSLRVF